MRCCVVRASTIGIALVLMALGSGTGGAQTGDVLNQAMIEAAREASRGTPPLEDRTARPQIPIAGPVNPETYRVGPGDVLQFVTWGRISRNDRLEVGPEGTVLLPGAGVLELHNHTLARARAMILERMRAQMRGVEMDVRLLRPRRFLVSRTGQVKTTGPIEASAASRVSDALPLEDVLPGASRRRVNVIHLDGTREVADLELYDRTGRSDLNPWLRDGDMVHVPVATEFLYIAGAVARPGRYELGPQDSLRTSLQLAGDVLPSADKDHALVVRWPEPFRAESLWISLSDIYSGRQNTPLKDGERIYIFFVPHYHDQHEAVLLGEVTRPGAYPITEGQTRLSDLVRGAGGFLPLADSGAIRVHRPNPMAGTNDPELDRLLRLSRGELTASEYEVLRTKLAGLREEYSVDWQRLSEDGNSLDLLLRSGDIVRVDRLVSSIRIDGEVRRPGMLEYQPGLKVEDYVRQSNGFTNRAWRSKVRITRAVTGQTQYARDVPELGPGDFVWVPEKPDWAWGQTGTMFLTVLGSLSGVVLAAVTIARQ